MIPEKPPQKHQDYLDAIELELQKAIQQAEGLRNSPLYRMLTYHMGWDSLPARGVTRGKRLRPMVVLLACSAAGGDWRAALPAAAAVELVHNFSLIHDDIEDHSAMRRGRTTVWKKWGIPQAINAGDAMFTLAHLHCFNLSTSVTPQAALIALETLHQACLHLTEGQYLDLVYEKRPTVTLEDYWTMIEGKTSALMSASAELGAISAGCDSAVCLAYRNFGLLLGLAFQVQDDYLGIWGDSVLTGKSNQSDLATKKKTLPVLYGLSKNGAFAERCKDIASEENDLVELANLLEIEGAKEFTSSHAERLINEAITALEACHPIGAARQELIALTLGLINRDL